MGDHIENDGKVKGNRGRDLDQDAEALCGL